MSSKKERFFPYTRSERRKTTNIEKNIEDEGIERLMQLILQIIREAQEIPFKRIAIQDKKNVEIIRQKDNTLLIFQEAINGSLSFFKYLLEFEELDPSIGRNELLVNCIDNLRPDLVAILLENEKVLTKLEKTPFSGFVTKRYPSDILPSNLKNRRGEIRFEIMDKEDDEEKFFVFQEMKDNECKFNFTLRPNYEKLKDVIKSPLFTANKDGIFLMARNLLLIDPKLTMMLLQLDSSVISLNFKGKDLHILSNYRNIPIKTESEIETFIAFLLVVFTHPNYWPQRKEEFKELINFCGQKIEINMDEIVIEEYDEKGNPYQCVSEKRIKHDAIKGSCLEKLLELLANRAKFNFHIERTIEYLEIKNKSELEKIVFTKKENKTSFSNSSNNIEEETKSIDSILDKYQDIKLTRMHPEWINMANEFEGFSANIFSETIVKLWAFWMRNPISREILITQTREKMKDKNDIKKFLVLATIYSKNL